MSPEWSQAILAGTVPVYIGAPNIASYALPGGWVDGRKFASGGELWAYLAAFDPDAQGVDRGVVEAAYQRFFSWKEGALAASAADGEGDLGTGEGVAADACNAIGVAAVNSWPLPPLPGTPYPADKDSDALRTVAAQGWRCFRRALDRCVHYSECRLCRYIHAVT